MHTFVRSISLYFYHNYLVRIINTHEGNITILGMFNLQASLVNPYTLLVLNFFTNGKFKEWINTLYTHLFNVINLQARKSKMNSLNVNQHASNFLISKRKRERSILIN